MSEIYDINELPEVMFPKNIISIYQYQQCNPVPMNKLTISKYKSRSFSVGRNNFKPYNM